MNRLILLGVVMLLTIQAQSQSVKEKEVPKVVLQKMLSLYPDAKNVKWEMEDGMYEGEFKQNKSEVSVMLSRDGMVAFTEAQVEVASLPAGLLNYVADNYPGAVISEASKVTDSKGMVSYELEIGGDEYVFDTNGNLISQSPSDHGKKED